MAYKKNPPEVKKEADCGSNLDSAHLQQQISCLQAQIQALCQTQALEHVFINGVTMLSEASKALAEPLYALAPKVRQMPEDTWTKLAAIHASLERPDYTKWPWPKPKPAPCELPAQTAECAQ